MRTKKEEPRNRATFGEADSGFKVPDIGCATDFSTTYAGLQERISTKFTPKRKRAETVESLYLALFRRVSEMSGAELIQAYLEFDKDRAFDVVWNYMHHFTGDKLFSAVRYAFAHWYSVRAGLLHDCGTELDFVATDTAASLVYANFCKDRMCPMCNWRRSLKVFGQVSKVMNELDGRGYRYLFLTLTVRNVWGAELSDAVQALYDGWRILYNKYMSERAGARTAEKRLKGVVAGTFRALEVTVSDGRYSPEWAGSFHPHLHVILAVQPSYFKRGHYLDKDDWRDLWRKACKLDYDPSVMIEAIRPKGVSALDVPEEAGAALDYGGAVAEVAKYPLKDADFVCDDKYSQPEGQYMLWLLNALRRRRLLGLTGCFREVARALQLDDMETGDLIDVDGGEGEAVELRDDVEYVVLKYKWRCGAYVEEARIAGAYELRPDYEEGVPNYKRRVRRAAWESWKRGHCVNKEHQPTMEDKAKAIGNLAPTAEEAENL